MNNATKTDVHLTAHAFANQLALAKLHDLSEHLQQNEKMIYACMKPIIDECIANQQKFHTVYQLIISGYQTKNYFDMIEEMINNFDKTLLK